MFFFSSDIIEKKKLKKLSKVIAGNLLTGEMLFSIGDLREVSQAEEELFQIPLNNKDLSLLLQKYNLCDIDSIKEIYNDLVINGGGQWSGSYYVPAATLCSKSGLKKYLSLKFDTGMGGVGLAYSMVEHF